MKAANLLLIMSDERNSFAKPITASGAKGTDQLR
jgi:hypothetical protein